MSNDFESPSQISNRDTTMSISLEHVQSTSDFIVVVLELLVDLRQEVLESLSERIRFAALVIHRAMLSLRLGGGALDRVSPLESLVTCAPT